MEREKRREIGERRERKRERERERETERERERESERESEREREREIPEPGWRHQTTHGRVCVGRREAISAGWITHANAFLHNRSVRPPVGRPWWNGQGARGSERGWVRTPEGGTGGAKGMRSGRVPARLNFHGGNIIAVKIQPRRKKK